MTVPFNIPGEESDTDAILAQRLVNTDAVLTQRLVNTDPILTQRLLDLYQILHEILSHRQPLTPLDDTLQSVNDQSANEVITLEPPFVDYDVQTQVKKKKVRRRIKAEEIEVTDNAVSPIEQQRAIRPQWIGVGQNLRRIADNFQNAKTRNESEVAEPVNLNSCLVSTIVSLSPFRDSLWSAVFVVGYRILSKNVR